ncbi:MAG TPA: 3-deoxy-D-manno-octulosonic acid transferase [Dissulfurispiraceae bacterium]|nr:3-deoxy-D-manno-octulosonic acid transferase [Dissulfurispiraceae bacterium]
MIPGYSFLYALALSVMFWPEYRKRPAALRKRWLQEKLGTTPSANGDKRKVVWVHAVSVGEVIASVPFVRGLQARRPDMRILLSTITDTGQQVARERFGSSVEIVYMPFDLPFALRRLLDAVHPVLFVIMETELWPNAIRLCSARGIPVALVNGRISERSFRGYRRIRFFMKKLFGRMSALCVQMNIYADRLLQLGAPESRIVVTGNLKFDLHIAGGVPLWTTMLSGPVIIAGSTHHPEEEIIIEAYLKTRGSVPDANLILAPRHPERFGEVEALLCKKGIAYLKRSAMHAQLPESGGTVILLDVMGELGRTYAACDIAVMGGSFIAHGGQNPLEPAFWGKAVLCGPHMENFPFIQDFYGAGAARRVNASGLAAELTALLQTPAEMRAMGGRARALLEENAGATEKTLDRVLSFAPL